jgi:hypothetical protein
MPQAAEEQCERQGETEVANRAKRGSEIDVVKREAEEHDADGQGSPPNHAVAAWVP